MDSEVEYNAYKRILKSWEKKFREKEKRNPTRADYKQAPSHVKEAYKMYWILKSAVLEETILNVKDDGDTDKTLSNSLNISNITPSTSISSTEHSNSTPDNVEPSNPVDTLQENDSTNLPANKDTVWGEHLKKNVLQENKLKLKKSTSFQFTAKLFKGTNFKKRNPRKFSLNRSKSTDTLITADDSRSSIFESASQDGVADLSTDATCESSTPSCTPDVSVCEDNTDSILNFSGKIKITQGTSFASFSSVRMFPKTEGLNTMRNKLNSGWLERCNQVCNLNENASVVEETNYDSDEDLVYSSEDENSRAALFRMYPKGPSIESIEAIESNSCPYDFSTILHKPLINQVKEAQAVFDNKSETADVTSVSAAYKENEPEHTQVRNFQAICEKSEEIPVKNTSTGTKRPLADASSGPTKRLKSLTVQEDRKRVLLEEKLASGKANENFVRVNLKKKIYVRGKKKMSVDKYKKQQWKMRKSIMNASDGGTGTTGGIVKCYKCGDVGHYARYCQKNSELVPKEYVDDEEDCVFPTLDEAAEMVKENLAAQMLRHMPQSEPVDDDLLRTQPIYGPNIGEAPSAVFEALEEFGYKNFRPGQEKAIMRILSGQSTLVISSTGSGKSLCYQLPAYLYAKTYQCITLVISPLVSLMEDQMLNFPKVIQAACLHTNQTEEKRKEILDQLRERKLSVLLVSPEAMVSCNSPFTRALIKDLPPVAFACIDEVHCVSQWSHNFRTSYLLLCKILKERFNVHTFLGLTATATKSTISCIQQHLSIHDTEKGVLIDNIIPSNLLISISKDKNRDQALTELLSSEPFSQYKSIIIYCIRRNECERIASYLRTFLQETRRPIENNARRTLSEEVEAYHAGLTGAKRKRVQTAFMNGKLRIVVATVAFGMGINKSDIRGIIHYNMPPTYEHYVQEIGRAGRDGLPARCHMFLDSMGNDLPELKRHIYANSVDRYVIRNLLSKVFITCDCPEECKKHEVAFSVEKTIKNLDMFQENITTMLCYLELLYPDMVQVLPSAYVTCTVQSYAGVRAFTNAAKVCPPLAFVVAEILKDKSNISNQLEFSVVELANRIGWKSNTVKYQLKNCEWTKVNDKPKKTGLHINFSDLGFHVLSSGKLSATQMDNALNSLYSMVQSQEKQALYQLGTCYRTFTSFAYDSVSEALTNEDEDVRSKSENLKALIREYFTEGISAQDEEQSETALLDEDAVLCEIRRLIISYKDCNFTGRAIARILHGIESPNFPATVWGRSPFWRLALKENFNLLCQVAAKELMKFK